MEIWNKIKVWHQGGSTWVYIVSEQLIFEFNRFIISIKITGHLAILLGASSFLDESIRCIKLVVESQ